jgi:hypothetical protein
MAAVNELFRRDALTHCPSCDYDLVGAPGAVCSECGYAVTGEDVALDERRRMMVELAPGMIAWRMLPLAAAVCFAGVWPLVFVVQAAAAGRVMVRGLPRLHARVFWRLWLMNLLWLQLIWVLPVALAVWRDWFGWGWSGLGSSYTYFGREMISRGLPMTTVGFLGGLMMWRWSWRRLCRAAGMPREQWPRARMNMALRIAVGPQGVIVLIAAVLAGVLWICDTFVPGWEYMVSR